MAEVKMAEAARLFGIGPNAQSALTAWEKAELISCPMCVKTTAIGIRWSIASGRLTGGVELAIRRMTTYQTLKLLVDATNQTECMASVPNWLNHNVEIE